MDTPTPQTDIQRTQAIADKLAGVKAAFRDNEISVFNPAHFASWDDIEWLLGQLTRLTQTIDQDRQTIASLREEIRALKNEKNLGS